MFVDADLLCSFQPTLSPLHLFFVLAGCSCDEKAATLKVSAKLRQLTKLAVVRENATRWSSTYKMIDRYFKIQPQLSALVELLTLLPTPVKVDTLSRGFKHLESFQAITIMLQRDGIPFTEVRGVVGEL